MFQPERGRSYILWGGICKNVCSDCEGKSAQRCARRYLHLLAAKAKSSRKQVSAQADEDLRVMSSKRKGDVGEIFDHRRLRQACYVPTHRRDNSGSDPTA